MIGVLSSQDVVTLHQQIIERALDRSLTGTQVRSISTSVMDDHQILLAYDISPHQSVEVLKWLAKGDKKLILFGAVPDNLINYFGWEKLEWPSDFHMSTTSKPAPINENSESAAKVFYNESAKSLGASEWRRPFERFDFTNEWNNMGYGAIKFDDSIWSVKIPLDCKSDEIASICVNSSIMSSYTALVNQETTSVLWFNRSVGPVDSFEWKMIENYISEYRSETLLCLPILKDIPWGYDSVITSRLDCDEDVESARQLMNYYHSVDVPFSLAIHTSVLHEAVHQKILGEVKSSGGAILSHTTTHAPNWGGSYEHAFNEGFISRSMIKDCIGEYISYAVSPFHQSPSYALKALSDIGYKGCVGGIICNDPEFIMARGGEVPGQADGFIGHSQQTMLHGDCLLNTSDPISLYKEAYDIAFETDTAFGYLDHPFSKRYTYGWKSEEERSKIHGQLIDYIRSKAKAPLFLNEDELLDFIHLKTRCRITRYGEEFYVDMPDEKVKFDLQVDYKGQTIKIGRGLNIL